MFKGTQEVCLLLRATKQFKMENDSKLRDPAQVLGVPEKLVRTDQTKFSNKRVKVEVRYSSMSLPHPEPTRKLNFSYISAPKLASYDSNPATHM